MNSKEARPVVVDALTRVLEREPTLAEVYAVQAVARYDGGYGSFRSPPHGPEGPTSNNWGAVQYRKGTVFNDHVIYHDIFTANRSDERVKLLLESVPPASPDPKQWFYAADYSPKKGWFWGPYCVYPTPVDGAAHVVRLLKRMGVLDVANNRHNWYDVAKQMYQKHYFTGTSTSDVKNITTYALNLQKGGRYFEKIFGETSPLAGRPKVDTAAVPLALNEARSQLLLLEQPRLERGSSGAAVSALQILIETDVNGAFDWMTDYVVRCFQNNHDLVVDGVVGPKTWAILLKGETYD